MLLYQIMPTFPEKGTSQETILQKFDEIQEKMRVYPETAFRIYSTKPHSLALKAISKFLEFNRNNIGTHTRLYNRTKGMLIDMEREVISMLGDLMGSTNVDGYVTQGGTEGNIMGFWIGRNILRSENGTDSKICLIKTYLTHYSVDKAADLLNIAKVVNVPLNRDYGMDAEKLEECINALVKEGYKKFLIALTLGYNLTGTIDPIDEIDAALLELENKLGIKTYAHLDAAIGGLVYPFVSNKPLDFRYLSIKSVSLDMHKTGFVPHTAGVFLCKKESQRWIERPVSYLRRGKDDTLSGSRPGMMAAACWSVILALGKEGFKKIIERELELKKYFMNLVEENKNKLQPFVITHPAINIAAVHFGGLKDGRLNLFTEEKYGLRLTNLIADGKTNPFYTIVFMPHIAKAAIDKLIFGQDPVQVKETENPLSRGGV